MNSNQNIALQASRGVAACFVLLFHVSSMSYKYFQYDFFGISTLTRSGGVDYFFVLTGFLLFKTYGHQIGAKKSVLPYLRNRLIRIYPFYWLITLIVLPVYFLVPSFGYGYETEKGTIIRSLLLLPQAHGPILPVAWSLSYFVLFYALFSVIMAIGKTPAYLVASIWIALTICNVAPVPYIGFDISRHFYLNFLFSEVNLEFALGCLLAGLTPYLRGKRYNLLLALAMAGFIAIWLNNKYMAVPFHSYLLYLIPATLALLGIVSIPEDIKLPRWVLGFGRLGNASYTILLTHLLSISVMMKLSRSTHLADKLGYLLTDLFVVVFTLMLCYISYHWAEKPLVARIKTMVNLQRAKSPKLAS